MIRRIVPVLAVAALLGACSSNSANTPEPGTPTMSRGTDGGMEGRGGRGGGGMRGEEMLMRGITLSTDQQQRIDAIRARYRTQMEQARQNGGTPDRTAMRDMMQKQQDEVRAVLTPDQQAQFDKNVADMRNRMQNGGGRRPNG